MIVDFHLDLGLDLIIISSSSIMDSHVKPDPAALVRAILTTLENDIIPLTSAGVSSGSKLFGAAILRRADLAAHTVATNNERISPLLHGEINVSLLYLVQLFLFLINQTQS